VTENNGSHYSLIQYVAGVLEITAHSYTQKPSKCPRHPSSQI